jgi:hypothetical protein
VPPYLPPSTIERGESSTSNSVQRYKPRRPSSLRSQASLDDIVESAGSADFNIYEEALDDEFTFSQPASFMVPSQAPSKPVRPSRGMGTIADPDEREVSHMCGQKVLDHVLFRDPWISVHSNGLIQYYWHQAEQDLNINCIRTKQAHEYVRI